MPSSLSVMAFVGKMPAGKATRVGSLQCTAGVARLVRMA
jgi:hypothetical protein